MIPARISHLVISAEEVEPRKPGESDLQYVRRLESLGHSVAGVKNGEVSLMRRPHHPPPQSMREPGRVPMDAGRPSVWIPWYFKRGALTLVTGPLFLFLIFCVVVSAFGAVIQGIALFRVSGAVFGIIGGIIAVSFGWIPVIMPPVLYYSLIKNLPGLWLRPDASRRDKILSSLAVLVLLPLGAYLVYHAVAWGIGWIADRDPSAAFAAGVTGSKPPVDRP